MDPSASSPPSSPLLHVDFPELPGALLANLNQQRLEGQLCDLSIHVRGRVFRAHRAVLAASSPYFHDQVLLKNMSSIVLPSVMDPGAFETVLGSAYTGRLSMAPDAVVNFLTVGSVLQMWHIVDKCTELLKEGRAAPGPASAAASASSSASSSRAHSARTSATQSPSSTNYFSPHHGAEPHKYPAEAAGGEGGDGSHRRGLYVQPSIVPHKQWVYVKQEWLQEDLVLTCEEDEDPIEGPDALHGEEGLGSHLRSPDAPGVGTPLRSPGAVPGAEARLGAAKLKLPAAVHGAEGAGAHLRGPAAVHGAEGAGAHLKPLDAAHGAEALGAQPRSRDAAHGADGAGPQRSSPGALRAADGLSLHLKPPEAGLEDQAEPCEAGADFPPPYDALEAGAAFPSRPLLPMDMQGNPLVLLPAAAGAEHGAVQSASVAGDGNKIFLCHCGKAFSHRSMRDRHVNMHLNLRPFACPVCAKRFKMKHHLTEHMKTHTGLKPYQCHVCAKRFMWRDSFVRHRGHCERRQGRGGAAKGRGEAAGEGGWGEG